ncbi:hypothetical protein H8356DRAFT_1655788 [Neocallimastix lanati (nom. inval.)]|jgi:amino acid transporter|nr:hypothetical protein H8356DRAFT_1655788 [Neocallimastix sp. JGI-2020a]
MNTKLFLCTLFSILLNVVNSLAVDYDDNVNINLNNPNAKYSKKISSVSKVSKGGKNILKFVLIAVAIIVVIAIVICICCCLGCCACIGGSGKKEKYESKVSSPVAASASTPAEQSVPYGSGNTSTTYPPSAYNPYQQYPQQPATQSPYGQPMYPQV